MDRPNLHAFVRELLANERLQQFAEALPTRARVSEPILPLVLAALYETVGGPLVCLLPEDADARDAAEAAAWYLGEERVGLLPSRGVRWESGLEPPPHLVGERARALEIGIDIDLAPDLPRLKADPLKLKQVLLNLTVNALQAVSPVEGKVMIEGRRRNGWVEVCVADNGYGMSPDALKAALRAGANDFLTKPIEADELLLRVQNLLSVRFCYKELLHHNAALARELRTRVRLDDQRAAERVRVRETVQAMIDSGGPGIVFQPFVELVTGRTLGVEALARFGSEPHRGPDQWFSDAAAVGLGTELELAAIERAERPCK